MLLLFNTLFGTYMILRIKDKREVQKIKYKLFLIVDDTSVYNKVLKIDKTLELNTVLTYKTQ